MSSAGTGPREETLVLELEPWLTSGTGENCPTSGSSTRSRATGRLRRTPGLQAAHGAVPSTRCWLGGSRLDAAASSQPCLELSSERAGRASWPVLSSFVRDKQQLCGGAGGGGVGAVLKHCGESQLVNVAVFYLSVQFLEDGGGGGGSK